MTHLRVLPSTLLALLASLLLTACATTTLDGTWTRPDFAGQRLQGPVMVVGVTRDDTVRRLHEDAMAAQLAARGVKALRSYDSVPGTLEQDSDERLQQAARKAGARYLLSTAVIGEDRETVITHSPFMYGGWGGYRGWYGSHWGMAFPMRADARIHTVFVVQTALTEVATDRIEWTARTRTSARGDIEREVRDFVDVIVAALERAGLVGPAAAR